MDKKNQTTVDRIIKTIIVGIENGTFKAGEALPAQRQMAEYFNVSRNVIREAVKVLEGNGILYSRQGSGIYVKSSVPSSNNGRSSADSFYTLHQILDLCRIIWHSSMISVVKNASDSEIKKLKLSNQKLLVEYSTSTVHQRFIYESSFGMNICQLSGNSLANDLMRELLGETAEIDYKIISHPRYKTILEIDSAILDALLSRDAYRAYFLANERDIIIEDIISDSSSLMEKTYSICIH